MVVLDSMQGNTLHTLPSPSQDDLEPRSGAPAYGFPSHRNSTGNDRVGANYGPDTSLSRNAGRASVDRHNARPFMGDSSSSGRATFAAPPARGMRREDEYGDRSQHKAEVHMRRSKYSNSGERGPAKAQVKMH